MNAIIVIGSTGEGKSEIVKQLIGGKKSCHVYDPNNEYGKETKYPNQTPVLLSDDVKNSRSRCIGSFEQFIEEVKEIKGRIVVFEEATGFLEGKISKDMKTISVNKMHTKNVYIFLFHSIIDVPQFLMRIANVVVLFKTGDEEHFIEKKYPRLLPFYRKLIGSKQGTHFKIKML